MLLLTVLKREGLVAPIDVRVHSLQPWHAEYHIETSKRETHQIKII